MMKKVILFLCSIILLTSQAFAAENCFLAKEQGKVLRSEGDCNTVYAPASTFKIALSLMGFDSDILHSKSEPSWPQPEGANLYVNVCKGEHSPGTWMRDSCLWYSQILVNKLGKDKFQSYVTKFSYGNMDLSGELTTAWISGSIKISPEGQVEFLQNLVEHKLPISKATYDKTKEIMFIQELAGGWKLYGKTGTGQQFDQNGKKTDLQHGWFVGYMEKGNRKIVFASHVVDNKKQNIGASLRARNEALIKLWYLIDELEK